MTISAAPLKSVADTCSAAGRSRKADLHHSDTAVLNLEAQVPGTSYKHEWEQAVFGPSPIPSHCRKTFRYDGFGPKRGPVPLFITRVRGNGRADTHHLGQTSVYKPSMASDLSRNTHIHRLGSSR